LKETITILQQAKAFLNFYYHQKENISEIILEKCMTKKKAKSCCPRPRTGQFRGPGWFEAKDLTLEAKAKYFKNCP